MRKESLITAISANIVNPDKYIWLHWSVSKNFGDDLSRLLCEDISGRTAVSPSLTPNVFGRPVYSAIGSVLAWPEPSSLEIWGSGFIQSGDKLIYPPKKIHSVRGALTREILVNQGFKCPEIYGDPATIYFSRYSHENKKSSYRVGVIPHYADINHKVIRDLCRDERVKLINVFDSAESIARQALECEIIASSSLHGLILADALEIPNYWLRLSNDVVKDGFKFHDYFSSVSRSEGSTKLEEDVDISDIIKLAHLRRTPIDVDLLMGSCPFRR